MKKLYPLFVIILISISCSKEFDPDQFPQEWKLVSMSGNQFTPTTIINESELPWQETYILNSDGTFTKSLNRDGIVTEASGTFMFKDDSNYKYLELSFITGISLVESCSVGKEIMSVISETKLQGTWNACDGMGLEYQRIK